VLPVPSKSPRYILLDDIHVKRENLKVITGLYCNDNDPLYYNCCFVRGSFVPGAYF